MLARESPERMMVYNEARRYCDRQGITDMEDAARVQAAIAHQHFMRAIEPWQQMKVREVSQYLSFQMPRHFVTYGEDGKISLEQAPQEPLPPQLQALVSLIDDMIIEEAQRWGLDVCPLPESP